MENGRKTWWNKPEFSDGPDAEEIRARADKELKEERLRHEEAMRKLDGQHNESMRRLNKNPWKHVGGWFGNLFRMDSGGTEPAEKRAPFNSPTSAMPHAKERYRFAGDSSGQCLIIWNRTHDEDAVTFSQAFLGLGFDVRVRENLKEAEIWKVLRDVTNNTNKSDGCSVCVIVSKGSSDYIKSADGRKLKLKNIVDLFSPKKALALRHKPKILLFQCDADNGKNTSSEKDVEPPFAPKYDDAFVLCSTHAEFLPTMKDFIQRTTLGEFQNLMDEISDVLVQDSTCQQTISFVSTLQKELFLHPKDRREYPPIL